MKKLFPIVALSLAAIPGISPLAAAPKPRPATGKWVLDFADHQCLATRDYGTAADPLVLALKPSPMGKIMQVAMVTHAKLSSTARSVPAQISIDGRPPLQSSLLAFNAKAGGLRSIRINLPLESFSPMRQASSVSIDAPGEIEIGFALTQMPALMAQMDVCLADLRHHWNIEEADNARLTTHAKPKAFLSTYVKDSDYPATATRKEEGGTVAFVLLIDEAGKIADCTLTQTSNSPTLDAQSCAIFVARAQFSPATGADGKPTRDAISSHIRWVMPD
jgi:TonB family protein